jgi:hypothetical protein
MVEVICKFREDAWNMMVKALLSIRDILKRWLSLVCDFFENSPGKKKIVQKITGVFGKAHSDEKEEDESEKKMKQKRVKAVREPSKKRNKSKLKKKTIKKKPNQADKAEDTIARIDVDINTEG